jgi:hypothetical protein
MKKLIILLLIANCPLLLAQYQWQITIGGTGEDVANSIIQTTDGGYVVAGTSISFGGWYIVKLSASGNMQWNKILSGTDHAYSIIQTTDGGYAVGGEALWDFCMVKFDTAGNMTWSKTIGGAFEERAYGVVQTSNGGYVMGGWTHSFGAGGFDFYVVKLSSSGNFLWNKTIGGSGGEYAYSITATSDGGCAVAGYTNSYGNQLTSMFIVKLDASGTLQWSRTVGQGTYYNDAESIIQTSDGGFAVAGETTNCGASCGKFYIVKLDNIGNLQWTRTVGGTSTDIAWSIVQTTDGGYAVAGGATSFGAGMVDLYLVKLDATGTLQWSKTTGGADDDYIYDLVQTADGGYAVVGYTHSFGAGNYDFYIVKLGVNGGACGSSTSPSSQSGTGGTTTSPTPTVMSPTPMLGTITPTISSGGTLTTICFMGIQPISNEIPIVFELYQNYPNPFNPATKIKFQIPLNKGGGFSRGVLTRLTIYDLLGREVTTLVNEQLKPGSYEVEWDASNYPSGVYFYKLSSGNYSETKKLILLK